MNMNNPVRNLQFQSRSFRLSSRWLAIIVTVVLHVILWNILSPGAYFGLSLLSLAILVWTASYGWREAVARLIDLLRAVEHL